MASGSGGWILLYKETEAGRLDALSFTPLNNRGPLGTNSPLPHAGVRYPPPLLYVAGVLAGWLLDVLHPVPIAGGASSVRIALGWLGVACWLALFLAAFAAFRRENTTIIPNRPATAFVTHGPYRFSRNPMYVSLVLLYVGATLLINSWWPFVFLPVVVVGIDRGVIAREEAYLAGAFPEYRVYTQRVRRWM